jgi:hypothetical protein
MANSLESGASSTSEAAGARAGWLKLGMIATASALAGGLAAAWWYRNTVSKLRQAGEEPTNPHFGISDDDSANDS